MCLLLFHIEGISIREIAQALNCSENTVKSRLNYGRKNLKIKAGELKKKGYRLYSLAPLPLLLYLLRAEESLFEAEGSTETVGMTIKARILAEVSKVRADEAATAQATGTAKAAGVRHAARAGASAARKGFLHTVAGKSAAVAVAVCAFGGAAFGLYHMNRADTKPHYVEKEIVPDDEKQVKPQDAEKDVLPEQGNSQPDPAPLVQEVRPEDYPALLAGNLTMEELEFVLAYGPEELQEGGFTGQDEAETAMILAALCEGEGSPIEKFDPDEMGRYTYSLADVNRLFSSFSTYQFTEDNDSDAEYGIHVEGEVLKYIPPTVGYTSSAEITAAEYTEEEMNVYYTFEQLKSGADSDVHAEKLAVFHPDETGKYRLAGIVNV